MWKNLVAVVVLTPFVAALAGAGILAWRIGDTWSEATTASLVTGLVAVCGGGFVVIALIISLIVGIPLATRFFHEAGVARQSWDMPPTRYLDAPRPYQEPQPPQLTDKSAGSWQSSGPAAYRLWEDDDPVEVRPTSRNW